METAIVSIACIALIVVGGMTMAQGFLTSVDSTAVGVETISVTESEIQRTELEIIGATTLFSTDHLRVRLKNSGQTKLASFSKWDYITQYDDGGSYQVAWLPYTEGTLGNNKWKKVEINVEAAGNILSDVFDPGILNPGEEILIDAKLSPSSQEGTNIGVVVSAPNGVYEAASFPAGETVYRIILFYSVGSAYGETLLIDTVLFRPNRPATSPDGHSLRFSGGGFSLFPG